MKTALAVIAVLMLSVGVQTLTAQDGVLILEHRFGADSDAITLPLRRQVVYKAELTGLGTLIIELMEKRPRPAFLVPIGDTTMQLRRFEVYALEDGAHTVRVTGLPTGDSALLRVYRDTVETERIARKLDLDARIGVSVAGGVHSGYRLDPTGGANPRGGADIEACVLLEIGNRAGTCAGVARQSFPDAGYSGTWFLLEERVRLVSHQFLGTHNTDLSAAIRWSKGAKIGPRNHDPDVLGLGIHVTQYFSAEGHRRGWRSFLAWQHGWLGNAPETEILETDRFTLGLVWVP